MKVLILSSPDEVETAESVAAVCTASGAESFIYGGNGSCKTGLCSCLESNDLVLIIWDDESLQKHDITFSTGYCVGKGKPFVLYRENKKLPPLCNGKAVVVSKKEVIYQKLILNLLTILVQLSKLQEKKLKSHRKILVS